MALEAFDSKQRAGELVGLAAETAIVCSNLTGQGNMPTEQVEGACMYIGRRKTICHDHSSETKRVTMTEEPVPPRYS